MSETKYPQPVEVLRHWVETINSEAKGLSAWEDSFMESIEEQIEESSRVSQKQQEILERIYAEKA